MPEISLFYGIRVTMYYNDHMPPHFHAEYNGHKALVDINNIQVIRGSLPNKQLRLILAWCTIHQDELMQNWELAKDMKPLNKINPLIQVIAKLAVLVRNLEPKQGRIREEHDLWNEKWIIAHVRRTLISYGLYESGKS